MDLNLNNYPRVQVVSTLGSTSTNGAYSGLLEPQTLTTWPPNSCGLGALRNKDLGFFI